MERKRVVRVVYFPSFLLKSSFICIILVNPFSLPFPRISQWFSSVLNRILFTYQPAHLSINVPKRLFDFVYFTNLVLSLFLAFLSCFVSSAETKRKWKSLFHKLWIFPNAFLFFSFTLRRNVDIQKHRKLSVFQSKGNETSEDDDEEKVNVEQRKDIWPDNFLEFLYVLDIIWTSISTFKFF